MQNIDTTRYAAFLLRVSLGVIFVAHGLLKVVVFTLPGTAQFFDSVGLPDWLAYPVAWFEIGGGTLLIVGIGTRILSALFLPILLGALWVHAGNGWVFSAANGGWEYPTFLLAATIVQVLLGSGAFTLPFGKRLVAAFRGSTATAQ